MKKSAKIGITASLIIAAVLAVGVAFLILHLKNIYRADKVDDISIGDSKESVQKVLGEPVSKTDLIWEYIDGEITDDSPSCRRIEIVFDDNSFVKYVNYDTAYNGESDYKAKNIREIKMSKDSVPSLHYIDEYDRSLYYSVYEPYLDVDYGIYYEDGSYRRAKLNRLDFATDSSSTVTWNDNYGSYKFTFDKDYVVSQICGEELVKWYAEEPNVIFDAYYIAQYGIHTIGESAFKGNTHIRNVDIYNADAIGAHAFEGCTGLEKIKFATRSIGDGAFANCSALKEFEVAQTNPPTLGKDVFSGCGKLGLTKTNGVTFFNNWAVAFDGTETNFVCPADIAAVADLTHTNIISATMPADFLQNLPRTVTSLTINGGKKINNYALQDCVNLVRVVVPHGIGVGYSAFDGCYRLVVYAEDASVGNNLPNYWDGGWNTNSNQRLPKRPVIFDYINNDVAADGNIYVTQDGVQYALKDGVAKVFSVANDIGVDVTIPQVVNYSGTDYVVTEIMEYAFFKNEKTENLVLPQTIQRIDQYAFANCSYLNSFKLPSSLKYLGQAAFMGCRSFTRIDMPLGVEYVGTSCFSTGIVYCDDASRPSGWSDGWHEDEYHSVVWDCKNNNAAKCGWTFVFSDGLVYSLNGNHAFLGLQPINLKGKVTIARSVEYNGQQYVVDNIQDYAFQNCKFITSLFIPDTVVHMGAWVCYGCPDIQIRCQLQKQNGTWTEFWDEVDTGKTKAKVIWGCTE
ncbi:MAG: leucine-rich repeat protein [Corallococcus sp.]|nr:leucine-rich repeat protein [Corallococcus sp.]MCM1360019.1 leucine-rich repeat protein [Corallococcus sp.]MCM1395576.1 leucine-rich repeat protein [Corallococcus sp.]